MRTTRALHFNAISSTAADDHHVNIACVPRRIGETTREINRNHSRNHRRKRGTAAVLVTAVLLSLAMLCTVVFSSGNAIQAQEDGLACKMYTSIRIERGDTLWAIAGRYMDGHYSSIQEYIDEVKFINELTSDTIHENAYLLVPYYQA